MKKIAYWFLLLFGLPLVLEAQKEDYVWVLGIHYCVPPPPVPFIPGVGTVDIDFHGDTAAYWRSCREISFVRTNGGICDEQGQLLFTTNGFVVQNALNDTVAGADTLGTFDFANYQSNHRLGAWVTLGSLMLKQPGHDSLVWLFNQEEGFGTYYGYAPLSYTVINRNGDGGLGAVTVKEAQMVLDTLEWGTLVANRHANGRDWWIMVSKTNGNRYYRWLFDPDGLHGPYVQDHGYAYGWREVSGQSVFSPDGEWLAKATQVHKSYLYRFDRCTGLLLGQAPLDTTDAQNPYPNGVGLAFSPSGRYLYKSTSFKLFQFDMWSPDPNASMVLVDTFDWFANPQNNTFFSMRLAPNGKIYMGGTSGMYHLHVIEYPDRGGTACRFVKRGVDIPTATHGAGLPNHPHYRLGPLDGSACDTLGLDQPLAAHAERLDFGPVPLGSAATLSFWLRNPGEGTLVVDTFRFDSAQYASPLPLPFTVAPGDSVQVPVTFAPNALPMVEAQLRVFHNGIAGISTVQLTGLGDSVVSALPAAATVPGLVLWPNPTAGGVQVAFTSARAFDTEAVLYDALGRAVLALPVPVVAGSNRFALPLEGLPGGVYSVMLRGVGTGRVVKN